MPTELLSLSDDLLALIARNIESHVRLCRFLQCCSRTLATAKQVDELIITTRFADGHELNTRFSLLIPTSWAERFVKLRSLSVDKLSVSGAARLILHLRSWPNLQTLSVRIDAESHVYDDPPKANMHEFVNDLATALRTGSIRLPALKHLEITDDSNWNLYSGPDDALLAALPPTPQLWWMAERPQHVRCRKLSRWRELAQEADLQFENDSDYTILSWLSTQICFWDHSRRGYDKVYEVLKEHGASEKATKLHYFHPVAHELEPTEADKKLPTPCLPP